MDSSHKDKSMTPVSHTANVHTVSNTKKGLFLSFLLTGIFFGIELIVGLKINSVAVIADAAHNFSAAAGVGIALLAIIFASKPPNSKRTFGFVKAEIFSAWINGIILFVMAYVIIRMGVNNLLNPGVVATTPMLILAVIGLIIGGIPAVMLYKKQKTDINVRGAFWHVMETVIGSAVVLLAALLIRYAGWMQADAILGMLLAPVLIVATWGIVKTATYALLDFTPKNLDLVEVKKEIEGIEGVEVARHIHAWTIGINKDMFSAHVKISDNADAQEILEKTTIKIKEKYNIYLSTIQIEKRSLYSEEAKEIEFN